MEQGPIADKLGEVSAFVQVIILPVLAYIALQIRNLSVEIAVLKAQLEARLAMEERHSHEMSDSIKAERAEIASLREQVMRLRSRTGGASQETM